MDVQNIEKLNQLISRTDMTGNEKVEWLIAFTENYQALQLLQTGVMARCNIDLIGKELEYISPITKAKTKFKVADVFVNIFNVGLKERMVYGEVFAVSENGNKYKIDEFSEVCIPQ